jgi:phosphopantothenoylcysteine decarboxylase/phosphopantothenate--cysteine ligase
MRRRLLITAGPTHEPIDPVRYLANRSSGKLGFAMTHAAAAAGYQVTLLLGPVPLCPDDLPATIHRYQTVDDLGRLLNEHFPECDLLVMASAVADYRLLGPSPTKLRRDGEPLTIQLEPTPDLVARCSHSKRLDQQIIGFALENFDMLSQSADKKLQDKQLDAIVANPLETMDADGIDATVHFADGRSMRCTPTGSASKSKFAEWFIAEVVGSL